MRLVAKIFIPFSLLFGALMDVGASDVDSLSAQSADIVVNGDSSAAVSSMESKNLDLKSDSLRKKERQDSIALERSNRRIYGWHSEGALGYRREADMDTTMERFYINNHALRKTINLQTLGNLGSPSQSAIFVDRLNKTNFLFFRPYQDFYTSMEDVVFYNTKDPFSILEYYGGGSHNRDNRFIDGLFTVNANSKLNFGLYGNWTKAYGPYLSLSTKYHNSGFFSSFVGGSFEYMAAVSFNGFESYENGGFTDDRNITDPKNTGNMEPANVPVFFMDNSWNRVHNWNAYLNLKKHFGFDREVSVSKDSSTYIFVPVTSIVYTMNMESDWRRYTVNNLNVGGVKVDSFYHSYNLNDKFLCDSLHTMDSTRFWQIRQNLGITLNEEFNRLMRFGLAAYLAFDVKKYTYLDREKSLASGPTTYENDSLGFLLNPNYSVLYRKKLGVGAKLSKHTGEAFTYDFFGEYYFLDEKEKAGSLNLGGTLSSKANWGRQRVEIEANAQYDRECPDFFEEYYFSNHISWNRDFDYKNTMTIDGSLRFPSFAFYDKLGLSATAVLKNLSNYIYWDKHALPQQHDGTIQLLTFSLKEHACVWHFHWDNDFVFQKCSEESILPLPSLNWYTTAYLRFDQLFHVLNLQVGVDARWNSAYYAPNYLPATGQFFLQDPESDTYQKYGDYMYMNAYVNLQLKRVRFYLQMNHLNKLWTNKYNSLYMRGYAMDPSYLKFGLSAIFGH